MGSNGKITMVLADDHPVFRRGLRDVVQEYPGLTVVGETGDGDRAIELVRDLDPDVLLLDMNMPGASGIDVVTSLREHGSGVRIIILTMHKEEELFNRVLDLGVKGYILKESAVVDIYAGLDTVLRGEYYISPAISRYLVNRAARNESFRNNHPRIESLSPSEKKILKLISENKTSKEIAGLLFISVRTVENHRMNICNKLQLHGCHGLLKFALENKSSL